MEIDICVKPGHVVQWCVLPRRESMDTGESSTKLGAYATVVAHERTINGALEYIRMNLFFRILYLIPS